MIGLVLASALLCVATLVGLLWLLFLVFQMQVRRFNSVVARDRLDDWERQMELLDPAERERVRAAPPPAVLAAMLALPSRSPATFLTLRDEGLIQSE